MWLTIQVGILNGEREQNADPPPQTTLGNSEKSLHAKDSFVKLLLLRIHGGPQGTRRQGKAQQCPCAPHPHSYHVEAVRPRGLERRPQLLVVPLRARSAVLPTTEPSPSHAAASVEWGTWKYLRWSTLLKYCSSQKHGT